MTLERSTAAFSGQESDGADIRPRVSVVIPCRNEVDSIESCLRDVFRFEEPEGGIEVLVVDGMSDDGTREVLQKLVAVQPKLRVLDNLAGTTPDALNLGIKEARGEFIARIDAHTRYAEDYILKCIEVLETTGADNAGGPARTEASSRLQKAIAAAYHSQFSVGGARFHDPGYEGPVDTIPYGFWRAGTFERFGSFDKELVRNQDDEHNLRIVRGGGLVWQSPAIRSWYSPRPNLRLLFRQYMQYGFWKVRVIQKHRLPASWRHLVPGAFLALLLATLGLGIAWPWALAMFVGLLGLYMVAVLAASLMVARREGWALLPFLPLVFPCFHFGYGLGFMIGVLNFVILRRGPGKGWKRLTRSKNAVGTWRRSAEGRAREDT